MSIIKSPDPESDVGEAEVQEVLYKEEMTKRKEETPAEKNRRKRFELGAWSHFPLLTIPVLLL